LKAFLAELWHNLPYLFSHDAVPMTKITKKNEKSRSKKFFARADKQKQCSNYYQKLSKNFLDFIQNIVDNNLGQS